MQFKQIFKHSILTVVVTLATTSYADITIGVSLPLTGAASSLGIPLANQVKLWPTLAFQ